MMDRMLVLRFLFVTVGLSANILLIAYSSSVRNEVLGIVGVVLFMAFIGFWFLAVLGIRH